MSRTPSTPRLRAVVPEALAREVVALVTTHLGRQILRLTPHYQMRETPAVADGPEHCDLGVTVVDLVAWAQTGVGEPSEALDAMQAVCTALYSRAGEPGTFGIGDLERAGDPTTAIGVVLLAAHARAQMALGRDVSPRELAALAGCAKSRVNQLLALGRAHRPGRVTATRASRLLIERVVGPEDAAALVRAGARCTFGHSATRTWLRITGDVAVAALATERGWTPRPDEPGTWIRLVPGRDE